MLLSPRTVKYYCDVFTIEMTLRDVAASVVIDQCYSLVDGTLVARVFGSISQEEIVVNYSSHGEQWFIYI